MISSVVRANMKMWGPGFDPQIRFFYFLCGFEGGGDEQMKKGSKKSGSKERRFQVRMTEEEYQKLIELHEETGKTMSDICRDSIKREWYLAFFE